MWFVWLMIFFVFVFIGCIAACMINKTIISINKSQDKYKKLKSKEDSSDE